MLRLRDAVILFADNRLYDAYKEKLGRGSPVHTSMKIIFLKEQLHDVLNSSLRETIDGKTFIRVQNREIREYIQIDDELLTPENKSKKSQLIVAEEKWVTSNGYVTKMLKGNKQRSIPIPQDGEVYCSDILNLLLNQKEILHPAFVNKFVQEYGNLKVKLYFQDEESVAGGLVSAGGISYDFRGSIYVPHWFTTVFPRVPTYAEAGKLEQLI